ncbi:HEAT repeat protein [Streptomyces sp. TLI_171]|nr:HEAT repeat protein [Streptomyces sp. TLI_171]
MDELRILTGLLTADSAADRAAACARLGMLAQTSEDEVRALIAPPLLERAEVEDDDEVTAELAWALSCTRDPRGLPVLLGLVGHPDADVRQAVTESFAQSDTETADAPEVRALLTLARDAEPRVRRWAVFALGSQLPAYSPEIRAVLHECLGDEDPEVAEEAVLGLAHRHDSAVLPQLNDLLIEAAEAAAHGRTRPDSLTLEAAAVLGHPELLPALAEFDPADPGVAEAVAACDPARREQLAADAWQLVEALHQRRPDLDATLCSERFTPDVHLRLPGAPDQPVYSVVHLMRRAAADPAAAVDLVDADLPAARS